MPRSNLPWGAIKIFLEALTFVLTVVLLLLGGRRPAWSADIGYVIELATFNVTLIMLGPLRRTRPTKEYRG